MLGAAGAQLTPQGNAAKTVHARKSDVRSYDIGNGMSYVDVSIPLEIRPVWTDFGYDGLIDVKQMGFPPQQTWLFWDAPADSGQYYSRWKSTMGREVQQELEAAMVLARANKRNYD